MIKEEIKNHINNLIDNFNRMDFQNQQEELFELYKTGEVEYVDVVDRYSECVKRIKQLEKQNKFLMERENKLQLIENMFTNKPVDLKVLSKLVRGE